MLGVAAEAVPFSLRHENKNKIPVNATKWQTIMSFYQLYENMNKDLSLKAILANNTQSKSPTNMKVKVEGQRPEEVYHFQYLGSTQYDNEGSKEQTGAGKFS